MQEAFLQPSQDYGGIWPMLMGMSGYAAMERDSTSVDPIDLLKAIYIVDLEHVAMLWTDWEDFEWLVSRQELPGAGLHHVYINRTLYMINLQLVLRGAQPNASHMISIGSPSEKVQKIIREARTLANRRRSELSPFTTRELLFSICLCDDEMRDALQRSGLNLEKLAAMVEREQPK